MDYFQSQSWYSGTVEPEDFRAEWLSSVEVSNIQLLKDYEKSMYGGSYFK